MTKVEKRPNKPGLIALAAAMTVAIFLADLSLPLGVAGGVPYVAVVLVGWWFDRPGFIFSLALLGSVLTVAGYFLSPEGGIPWMVATNRFLALAAIWITAVLLTKAKRAEVALRYARDDLERQVEARTKDIRAANKSLRASEEQVRLLMNSTAEAIYGIDLEGSCSFANPACAEMLGYDDPAELLGRQMHDLIHHTRADGTRYPAEECLIYQAFIRGEGTHADDEVLWRADGTSFSAEYWSHPVRRDGVVVGAVVTFLDITERRRVEESERQLRSQLAHAGRLSTVGNMATGLAHEISQPLSAIGSYVQAGIRLLRSGREHTEDVLVGLEKANQQVTRAADIVTWLRGIVAKEETEKIELDLNACIGEVADFLESEIHMRKCKLTVHLADSLPAVMADKVQIQQVILNLMQNSMEAADQDAPRGYRLKISTSTATEGSVQVEVEDNGPGIPAEIRDDLFSPFVTTKSDGLGFGLSISKSIIEAHGGRIWAVSDAGRGATFAFTLPIAACR